jgi:hypothetical protein
VAAAPERDGCPLFWPALESKPRFLHVHDALAWPGQRPLASSWWTADEIAAGGRGSGWKECRENQMKVDIRGERALACTEKPGVRASSSNKSFVTGLRGAQNRGVSHVLHHPS